MSRRSAAALALASMTATLALAPSAAAQSAPGHCPGATAQAVTHQLGVARIAAGRGNTYFVRGVHDDPACPNASETCRARAHLVPGDTVLAERRHGAFVCASFADGKGRATSGWLPGAALEPIAFVSSPSEAAWLGRWRRSEAEITIRRGKGKALSVEGTATLGGGNRTMVARGNVRTGSVSGAAVPVAGSLIVAEQPGASFETAGEEVCVVRLRLVGELLLAEDKGGCGGLGVSFTGLYRRQR